MNQYMTKKEKRDYRQSLMKKYNISEEKLNEIDDEYFELMRLVDGDMYVPDDFEGWIKTSLEDEQEDVAKK